MLSLENVSKSFGGLMAVNDVNMEVKKGDIHAIIGPNGAGKTTLFNLITGYHHPDTGKVVLRKENITGLPRHIICQKGIARSFQRINIYPKLTVFQSIQVAVSSQQGYTFRLFSLAERIGRKETEKLLDELGLPQYRNLKGEELSHGDKKRLELAISLANKPELLLLDEPTAGMAPEETRGTLELIQTMSKEKGLTILFTEHDISAVFAIAKRITVMHQGAIIAEGLPEEVRANPEVQRVYLGES
jgi:branched-chain amino acid transport system ATP-binding protein